MSKDICFCVHMGEHLHLCVHECAYRKMMLKLVITCKVAMAFQLQG